MRLEISRRNELFSTLHTSAITATARRRLRPVADDTTTDGRGRGSAARAVTYRILAGKGDLTSASADASGRLARRGILVTCLKRASLCGMLGLLAVVAGSPALGVLGFLAAAGFLVQLPRLMPLAYEVAAIDWRLHHTPCRSCGQVLAVVAHGLTLEHRCAACGYTGLAVLS